MRLQRTLADGASCTGIGIHSGKPAQINLLPAAADSGIVFVRTDLPGRRSPIAAHVANASELVLCTTIRNARGDSVATVEHLMAAFAGLGLDNAVVEIDGPEVPIMDGSAAKFCALIESAGLVCQGVPRRHIRVIEPVEIVSGTKWARLSPTDGRGLHLKARIDFQSEAIGVQTAEHCLDADDFENNLAFARTFGFARDIEMLRSSGFARGGSLQNAVVVDGDVVLNPEGLRYENEFARHKLLDAIGDLALAGAPIIGAYEADRPGHALNNALVRKLLDSPDAWQWEVDGLPEPVGYRPVPSDYAVPPMA